MQQSFFIPKLTQGWFDCKSKFEKKKLAYFQQSAVSIRLLTGG